MPALAEDQIEASRSATERDHDSEHLNSENNTLITEAISTGSINGQKWSDLNEIDYADGSALEESSYHARKTSPRIEANVDVDRPR